MTKAELKNLIDCAAGRRRADLVIKNCRIVNVLSGEIYAGEVAIADGKIIGMGTTPYDGEQVIDAGGKYLAPGFIDAHIHIESSYISPEQLEWLDNELATEKGKPVFVIIHQPLKLTHNLPTTWGNGTNKEAGSMGPQNDEFKAILAKHAKDSTVVLINGHLHAGFSQYSYQQIDGFHSVNAPAFSIENKDGEEGGNGSGLTYIVEVYEDEVLLRARNCRTGEWLPKWDTTIAL